MKCWFGNNSQGNNSPKSKVNNLDLDKNINENPSDSVVGKWAGPDTFLIIFIYNLNENQLSENQFITKFKGDRVNLRVSYLQEKKRKIVSI